MQNVLRKLKSFPSFYVLIRTSPSSLSETESPMTDVGIRARAWVLDAVLDVTLHPDLLIVNGNETEISHQYVEKIFESCEKIIANTMKGLDLISFSLPKQRLGMTNKNAVPVTAILHGTHEISIKTVQAMFARMEGLWTSWTPLYFGPGTWYKALEDHAMYETRFTYDQGQYKENKLGVLLAGAEFALFFQFL